MSDKLNINNEMRQLDLKNRNFYDELSEEERKKFSTFILLRWASAIQSSGNRNVSNDELASYYIQVTNLRVNKNFWALNKHPKLQWQLLTSISPGAGVHKHEWIAFNSRQKKNKKISILSELFPDLNSAELDIISNHMNDKEITEHLKNLGYDDKEIKKRLKS